MASWIIDNINSGNRLLPDSPNCYLNHCWFIISRFLCHSYKGNSIQTAHTSNHYKAFEYFLSETKVTSPKGQWVNSLWPSDAIWRHRSQSTLAQVMACCLTHQALTWTNVDLSSLRSCGIHLTIVSQWMPQPSITEISFEIDYLKFYLDLPGANELMPSQY